MTHVENHCILPRPRLRDRVGTLYACECGKMWRVEEWRISVPVDSLPLRGKRWREFKVAS